MHVPISLDDNLHFYQYLNTHVLIAEGQLLLLIDVPIQNRAQQVQIYQVCNLPVPHNNLSAQYKIIHRHIGVTYNETKAVTIKDKQCIACQHANRQFCRIDAPFQFLTNPLSCIMTLYAKTNQGIKKQCCPSISHLAHIFIPIAVTSILWIIPLNPKAMGSLIMIICPDKAAGTVPLQQPFNILKLSPACSAMSRYFYQPPCYEYHSTMINVSLDTANINAINILTLDFKK